LKLIVGSLFAIPYRRLLKSDAFTATKLSTFRFLVSPSCIGVSPDVYTIARLPQRQSAVETLEASICNS
jgi:hypothetical protein